MPEPQTESSREDPSPPEKGPPPAPHPQFPETEAGPISKKPFPKGPVILDKNGKPCRSCTSFRDWAKQSAHSSPKHSTSETTTTRSLPDDCPPDVEALGRSTWTLLHTIAASYPSAATPEQQREMKTFMTVFARLYPCWVCAEDFRGWIARPENTLRVGGGGGGGGHLSGRSEFARWMCNAHNDVNLKLGKKLFDCGKVEERWRTGWKDGRCD